MSTYQQIQTRVLSRLIDTPTVVRSEVPTLVNEALRQIMKLRSWFCMESHFQTITSVANMGVTHLQVAKPADWKEGNGKPYYQADPTGRTHNLEWWSDRRLAEDTYGERGGYPRVFVDIPDNTKLDGSSNFYLWPYADGTSAFDDGEYRISVPYYRWFPALSAPTDTNWFTMYCDSYLIYQATANGFLLDWDPQNASIWQQKAQQEYALLSKADKLKQVQNVQTLAIRTTGARRD